MRKTPCIVCAGSLLFAACSRGSPSPARLIVPEVPLTAGSSTERTVPPRSPFTIVAEASGLQLDVSLLEGATFLHCGPYRPRDPSAGPTAATAYDNEVVATRLVDGALDPTTSVKAIAIFGRWPDDAWRDDDSQGDDGDYHTHRYATWTGTQWQEVQPRREMGFGQDALAILPWGRGHLLVMAPFGVDDKLERQAPRCFLFEALGSTPAHAPDARSLCIDSVPPDHCESRAYFAGNRYVAALPTGEVLALGTSCAPPVERTAVMVWRPGGPMRVIRLPGVRDHVDDAQVLAVSPDEVHVVVYSSQTRAQAFRCDVVAGQCWANGDAPDAGRWPGSSSAGALVRLASGELIVPDREGIFHIARDGTWTTDALHGSIESVAGLGTSVPWAVADGHLYRGAADRSWTPVPLPTYHGTPLSARKVVARGDEVWVFAVPDTRNLKLDTVLLELGRPRSSFRCTERGLTRD